MVCYDDGLGAGKSLLALKTTDSNSEEYSLWIYQCNSLVRFMCILKSHLPHILGKEQLIIKPILLFYCIFTSYILSVTITCSKHLSTESWSRTSCNWYSKMFCMLVKTNSFFLFSKMQEQAQAICKVLSTAFDSVLTSEKSWILYHTSSWKRSSSSYDFSTWRKKFISVPKYFLNYFGIMFKLYIILSLLLLNSGTKNPPNVLLLEVCAKLHYFNIS